MIERKVEITGGASITVSDGLDGLGDDTSFAMILRDEDEKVISELYVDREEWSDITRAVEQYFNDMKLEAERERA